MNHRQARVAQEIRARLTTVLTHRIRDPRLDLVTITGVEVSADFSFARVYYRAHRDPSDAQRALQKAKPFIRRQLAKGLPLRRVPELDFRLDETADRAAHLEEVLQELKEERELREHERAGDCKPADRPVRSEPQASEAGRARPPVPVAGKSGSPITRKGLEEES